MDASRLVYAVSIGIHVAGGLALAAVQVAPPKEVEVIEMQTVELPKPEKPPPPPDPPPEAPAPKAAPRPAAPPPPTADAAPPPPPDFGFVLGAADGPGGIAVAAPPPPAPPKEVVRKQLSAPKSTAVVDDCGEEATRPKATGMPHPAYTEEARAAGVEGKVRVQLTVDPSGAVSAAEVLEGLGHGLDEAALAAVKGATFSPALRCGRPVSASFTVSVRFTL